LSVVPCACFDLTVLRVSRRLSPIQRQNILWL